MNQELHPKTLDNTRLVELVVSAQSGCQATQHELMTMAEKFKNNFIVNLSRRNRLTSNDIDDAQQEGVFWVLEAIQCYDAERTEGEAWASFITFVYRVVSFRFKDYLRRCHREGRREPLASALIEASRIADRHASRQSVDDEFAGPESDNPAHITELHESSDRLNAALSQLNEDSRELWDLLASGMRLGSIAAHFGISYESVRRRGRRLLAKLKSRLAEG